MVNRATFYYHFEDKYDLLEKVLSEVLLINLNADQVQQDELNEEAIVRIFLAITNFQNSLSNRCHSGYEDTIARIINRASVEWRRNTGVPPEEFIKSLIPFIMYGIDFEPINQ